MDDNDATSLALKNVHLDQDVLSAEDLAWADSCLIENPEISETNLDSIKESLLDILSQHFEILTHSTTEPSNLNDVSTPETFSSVVHQETLHTSENERPDVLFLLNDISAPENSPLVMDEETPHTSENKRPDVLFSLNDIFATEPSNSNDISAPENFTSIIHEETPHTSDNELPDVLFSLNDVSAPVNFPSIIDEETSYTSENDRPTVLFSLNDVFATKSINSNDVSAPEKFPWVINEETPRTSENKRPDVLFSLKTPFLPHYNDEMMNTQFSNSDSDFVFSETMVEPPSRDIFKVWDLEVPVEEDELVKELKAALSVGSSKVPKGTKGDSLDDLVEGIADLSLK